MPIVAVGDKRYELSEVLASDRLDALFSDAWTGSRVWNASIFLSKHLLRLHDERQFITTALQSVIELGSGCGLIGLVARDVGAAHVVVTDQAEIVDLLSANVAQNTTASSGTGNVHAAEFTWGSPTFRSLWIDNTPFDYILVSDCTYSEHRVQLKGCMYTVGINPIYGVDSWRNLARSIRDLGSSTTVRWVP
ncbi:hypothetical protein, variant 2 [Aphanomyces astaci]|uniref:Methyltransferase small domain-containing protein n=1 Tax=Aphanomyces astaci TaxID=112090 RepID=W4HAC1_APHAT|nr:hypothetical protein, variant 2 [Aphanomyces astaci]ETV88043.1 hypothetical protein, variant 2 [Aphanomyces astaci]|eukprot:XP_009822906.1 hypothetical protein, variant 2 [Aphanomyces astaci]